MPAGTLTIDLSAIAANWTALDALSGPGCQTGAVVKADAYGLGVARVAPVLAAAGARSFFVALAQEAVALRAALGPGPVIWVFGGIMPGDAQALSAADARPLLNSPAQVAAFRAACPGAPCGLQLDSGMNRLGLEPAELAALDLAGLDLRLVMSHLACADTPDHPQNAAQLAAFRGMAGSFRDVPLSLAATGGTVMGRDFRFDLTRPGIGLYGGLPFAAARPVLALDLPVIQVREVQPGESVGYGATWRAPAPRRIATLAAGYADGLHRALGRGVSYWAGDVPCPGVGRVSMDLVTVDVTHLDADPDSLRLLGPHQGIDAVAEAAGTIGYEVLTSLGPRFDRVYKGAA
ncbi:alanine racemase [Rhodobacteraceae bacterium 2CG4]|uniref:Alanine racemase n=1 Tax=Halovulum marinum TaxID=2662447 RepID=A0A6L5YZ56_9RHOB|nr:alanine racemase [Halovulum marinum]MSU88984.1 alanine racemase [Halovulum marinum]